MRISDWSSDVCSSDLYVDWGLFHVEPDFLPLWRRYARALKQRNSLLKQRVRDGQLDAWDHELAEVGEPMTRLREAYLAQLQVPLGAISGELAPMLGPAGIEFHPGWRRDELSLADALLLRSEEHTSELQSLMRISYAVFSLKKKKRQDYTD